ncbi:MAG TPA: MOSC domain-containing protein [Longimicrobium sp.]|nr:MOSC domain-containing protein [Longimicrobium sp.]
MSTPRILSIQVGQPRTYGVEGAASPMDRPWTTSFFKEPVAGPVRLGRTNLEGDAQADPRYHGGPDKAVMAYAAAHYPAWRAELGLEEMGFGGFGENFTVEGQDESAVCVGDVYAVGTARVQVSQPRAPCWKIARRWRVRDLSARVQRTGRTGWYLRVLEEGVVEPGVPLELLERPNAEWSVARINQVLHGHVRDPETLRRMAAYPLLSDSTREWLLYRIDAMEDESLRLVGPNEE